MSKSPGGLTNNTSEIKSLLAVPNSKPKTKTKINGPSPQTSSSASPSTSSAPPPDPVDQTAIFARRWCTFIQTHVPHILFFWFLFILSGSYCFPHFADVTDSSFYPPADSYSNLAMERFKDCYETSSDTRAMIILMDSADDSTSLIAPSDSEIYLETSKFATDLAAKASELSDKLSDAGSKYSSNTTSYYLLSSTYPQVADQYQVGVGVSVSVWYSSSN